MLWWVLLFALGLGLLFAEAFIPSGGVLGILAVGCTVFALFQVFAESTTLGLVFSFLTVAYVAWLIHFWLHRTSQKEILAKADTLGTDRTIESLDGQIGEALTILRPTGTARFGDKRVTVVTLGGFIARGARLRVVDTSGNRVVVREVAEDEPADSPADAAEPPSEPPQERKESP